MHVKIIIMYWSIMNIDMHEPSAECVPCNYVHLRILPCACVTGTTYSAFSV